MIRIDDFQIDEFNEAEMAAHRVSPDEVFKPLAMRRAPSVAMEETELPNNHTC